MDTSLKKEIKEEENKEHKKTCTDKQIFLCKCKLNKMRLVILVCWLPNSAALMCFDEREMGRITGKAF